MGHSGNTIPHLETEILDCTAAQLGYLLSYLCLEGHNCYDSVGMTNKLRKKPRCSMCGRCCRAPVILITKPSDYRRWTRQERSDILRYASVHPVQGYGDLWIDIEGSEESSYCPFIKKVSHSLPQIYVAVCISNSGIGLHSLNQLMIT